MKHFYTFYQFIVPLIFFPFTYWLWWNRLNHNYAVTSLVIFVPVVSYYIFVVVGITHFRLWKMNTRPAIKGVRPHHGFVLATGMGLLTYVSMHLIPTTAEGIGSVFNAAFLGASVIGFWNWLYETYAIKSGFISIYTKKVADGASAEEAVSDYAPLLFGSMGACYAAMVKVAENTLLTHYSQLNYWAIALIGGAALIFIPAGLYLLMHKIKHNESGLKSYIDVIDRKYK